MNHCLDEILGSDILKLHLCLQLIINIRIPNYHHLILRETTEQGSVTIISFKSSGPVPSGKISVVESNAYNVKLDFDIFCNSAIICAYKATRKATMYPN